MEFKELRVLRELQVAMESKATQERLDKGVLRVTQGPQVVMDRWALQVRTAPLELQV